ncbi:glucosidase 2 subunit beta isoform X1 [Monodelphis domestica]|nr:glucosidase 2 subunit beta isoform X1 [Monodelphis domestica]
MATRVVAATRLPDLLLHSVSSTMFLPPPPPPLLLLLLLITITAAVEVKRPRGVSLTNHHFYDKSKPFTCLDGSSTIPFDQVNDDYCDCQDGSDEPGTAACPEGRFHCTNAGYKPHYIPSSRVNDGICDCCDATDEYNSGVVCENTCREMGRKEKETLEQMAEVAREGFRLKKILIEEGKKGQEEKRIKLLGLQESKKTLEEQVAMLRAVKEEAEKPEKESKERHQRLWEEQQAAAIAARDQEQAASAFQELDDNTDGVISVAELQTHPELDPDGDGALSEAEAQAFLGEALQVDAAGFREGLWAAIKDKYQQESLPTMPPLTETTVEEILETPEEPSPTEDEDEGPGLEEEAEEDEDDEEESPEEDKETLPPQPVKVDEEVEKDKMPPYDERTQAYIDAAQEARDHFEEAEKSLTEMEESIRNLEQEMALDLGPSGEFSYLFGQCYELSTNEYIYRLCPFNRVTQKPNHGGSETNLGTWGSWDASEEEKFHVMHYEHGTGCWQGPNRSTKVKLVCGKETVVTSATEPSRCEYLMELVTPAACQEPPPESAGDPDHDEL